MHRQVAWDDLLYVLAVGRAGTLSGAARDLGVNHTTIYRRIGSIEAKLGTRLFNRRQSGYSPTPAAEAMIALAARIEGDIIALERRLSGEDLLPSGKVRVTTAESLTPIVTPLCAEFRNRYPDIELELVTGSEALNLSRRDADVAIRPTVRPDDQLVGRKLSGIAFAVYGAADYLATNGGSHDWTGAHQWVGLDESLAHLRAYAWLEREIDPALIGFRASSFRIVLEALSAGMGLGLAPCFLADPTPGLVRCSEPIEAAGTGLWLLVHPDLRRTARIRALLDFMSARLVALKPRLEGR